VSDESNTILLKSILARIGNLEEQTASVNQRMAKWDGALKGVHWAGAAMGFAAGLVVTVVSWFIPKAG